MKEMRVYLIDLYNSNNEIKLGPLNKLPELRKPV